MNPLALYWQLKRQRAEENYLKAPLFAKIRIKEEYTLLWKWPIARLSLVSVVDQEI